MYAHDFPFRTTANCALEQSPSRDSPITSTHVAATQGMEGCEQAAGQAVQTVPKSPQHNAESARMRWLCLEPTPESSPCRSSCTASTDFGEADPGAQGPLCNSAQATTPPHHEAPPAAPQLEKHAMPQISLSLASLGGALDSSEHAVNGHEALNTGLGGDGPAHEELPHVQVDVTSSASSVSQPLEGKSVGLAAESPPPPAVEDIRLRLARSLHVLKEVRRRSSMSGDSNAANVRESGLSTVGASPLSTETAPRRGMEQAAQLSRRSH